MHELILGGQKSGKSRRAEQLTQQWLKADAQHDALFIATAQACDDEMRQRIARHQKDRTLHAPGLRTLEEPLQLAHAIGTHSNSCTLVVVDCLTLWLTNQLMPHAALDSTSSQALTPTGKGEIAALLVAIQQAPGPLILVSNEIGLGVIPLGREVRAFVDALGLLNQQVAQVCAHVTLMAAGLPLTLKAPP
ncbi:MAG: bifunctional adenosylcobinamide kinase/adenosylcobinamide-phosphate guanylyltransferase [Burkholderiales bacterium]